jgi:hypothetical protein
MRPNLKPWRGDTMFTLSRLFEDSFFAGKEFIRLTAGLNPSFSLFRLVNSMWLNHCSLSCAPPIKIRTPLL